MILTLGLEVGANYLINLPGITHILNSIHYYRNDLWSRTLVPVTIRPGTNKSFSRVQRLWYGEEL